MTPWGENEAMAELPKLSEVQAKTEKDLFDLLQTDLTICSTVADLVTTELRMGRRDIAQRALAKAEDIHGTATLLLLDVTNIRHRNKVQRKLNALRTKLDYVQSQFRAAT